MDRSHPAPMAESSWPDDSAPEISIIVPARNEEVSLGDCLQSLTAQRDLAFEIIVVDDGSTDRTREIAESFAGVRVISAPALCQHWTGKNNALVAGSKAARAQWLLFTDADTVHLPGSLARALNEARARGEAREAAIDLLSYSPQQVVLTFAERAVMPVVFAELAAQYPPHKVRQQNSNITAANGQYILVRRAAYDAVGGHAAVATEILEDVALARLFRESGKEVYFRYGGDVVRTRMYRNWAQLEEGWTKNLALLFPQAIRLAWQSLLFWCLAWSSLAIALSGVVAHQLFRMAFVFFGALVYRRIRVAHFSMINNLIAMACGLPMFAYLLLRSKRAHGEGQVSWKGRAYEVSSRRESASVAKESKIGEIKNQELRAEN
ncbi:MAG: glycosyltransferase [Terriglobales bacterium]